MKDTRRTEQLKDRRDYRQALIHRRETIDAKILATEIQIRQLQEKQAK